MRTLKILMTLMLLAASTALLAQSDEASASAEERAQREALRAELEQARTEVAEAARKLARIQRELSDGALGDLQFERLREFESMHEEMAGMEERIHREVIRGLRMSRPRLGVLLGDDDDPNTIMGLTPGSGAEKAGIQAGDRLLSINGQDVDAGEMSSLRDAMEGVESGDTVPVAVDRDGERLEFDVTVSSPARDVRVLTHDIMGAPRAPDAPHAPGIEREVFVIERGPGDAPRPPMPPRVPHMAALGHHSDMMSNHAGLEPYFGTAEGVLILRVDADNPLQLRDGDVVLRIDGEAVSRPVDIGRALLGHGGDTITLEVLRAGERMTLEAELPEAEAVSGLLRMPALPY